MFSRVVASFFAIAFLAIVAAGTVSIPSDEMLLPPTLERLAALTPKGSTDWEAISTAAQFAAMAAYEQDKLTAAERWFYIHRWAALFAESEREFVHRWIKVVESAGANHGNMPKKFAPTKKPVGEALSHELQCWLLGHGAVSEEFFSLLSPVDYVPQVFALLEQLFRAAPADFKAYPSLALALALVYDVPAPPDWPHGQVTRAALPPRPTAVAAFQWWVKEDKAGRTYHRLGRLRAEDLKFVVDTTAAFTDLEWSQRHVRAPLAQFADAYSMINYRLDRIQNDKPSWGGKTYTLPAILAEGGICVDQAYFAVHAGKARGIPTLLFRGAGLDGRHAWFGYLRGDLQWQLDAGRYAEQRFVTGLAYDPQTWLILSDHELKFLAERFRALPTYRQSRIHAMFAEQLLASGRAADALVAANKAVNYERRHFAAWQLLVAVQEAIGTPARDREATYRQGVVAFQKYPDLQLAFAKGIVASLRERGETSLADAEERRLLQKYHSERSDLTVREAAERLARSFSQPLPEQVRAYNATLDQLGRDAGIEFFDKIVVAFAEHLVRRGEKAEAMRAVERAQRTLRIEPGSQLEQELRRLLERVRK